MTKLLQWPELYSFQKFLPLLTRWQLFHFGNVNPSKPLIGYVEPVLIKKKRAPKGIASYEIQWRDNNGCFSGLIPYDQVSSLRDENPTGVETLWSTIEPMDLVERAYPALVEAYHLSKVKPSKARPKKRDASNKTPRKTKRNKKTEVDTENEPPDEPVKPIRVRKARVPKVPLVEATATTSVQQIDRFFAKTKSAKEFVGTPVKPMIKSTFESPRISTSSKPLNWSYFDVDSDQSGAEDADLSNIIKGIVTRPPELTELLGRRLHYEAVNLDVMIQDKGDESFDDFDRIVMQNKSSKPKPARVSQLVECSTPILVQKFMRRQSFKCGTPIRAPLVVETDTRSDAHNESHFFGNVLADVDAFERSVDYFSMKDEFECNDKDGEGHVIDQDISDLFTLDT